MLSREYGFSFIQIPGLFEKLCLNYFSLSNDETLSDTIIATMVSKTQLKITVISPGEKLFYVTLESIENNLVGLNS